MLSHVGQGAVPLSRGRNPPSRPGSREGSVCRSVPPKVGIMLSCVGWSVPLSKGVSEQGHVIVSPAVGWNQIKKELLKQCLKNTWRQAQKTCHCFSFKAPRIRSAGVGDVGTSSLSHVHLQMGRGVWSRPQEVKVACFGVRGGGVVWWALEASEQSSARFQFFWGGPGQTWGKTQGSALDFLPGRRAVKW